MLQMGTPNEEQLEFIHTEAEAMKLLGIPGGGKTKTIIDKIMYMHHTGLITKNSEFMILTFSKKAREDFLQKGEKQNDKLFNKNNIRTIHSLAGLIMFNNFGKKNGDLNTVIASLYYHLDNENTDLDRIQCLKNCKYIFVDEAQDISDIQYNTICKISKLCDIKLRFIGDPDQNIYQFQNGSDKYLLEHPGHCVSLVQNYRSSKNIVNFINEFRPWKDKPKIIANRIDDGKLPQIYCNELESLLDVIYTEITETNIPFEDIAIIGPVKKGKYNSYGGNASFGLQIVAEYFEKRNIQYKSHYFLTDNDTNNNRITNKEPNCINLMTIHGSKGLEFKKVILLNFHLTTMSRIPARKQYEEFKYLWYVGLSRAMDELTILIEKNKYAWTELRNINQNLYELHGEEPRYSDFKMKEEISPEYYYVTDLLDNTLLTEIKRYELNNLLDYTVSETVLYDIKEENLYEHDKYSALYGIFIENVFQYYSIFNDTYQLSRYLDSFIKKNNSYLSIPAKLIKIYDKLKRSIPLFTLNHLNDIKNTLDEKETQLYSYLLKQHSENKLAEDQEINIISDNGVSIIDSGYIVTRCKKLKDNHKVIRNLFEICLYFYQLENECGHLLKNNFEDHISSLRNHIKMVKELALASNIKKFQVKNEHPNLPIIGVSDAITSESLIDFKFTKSFKSSYVYQLMLYYNNHYPKWDKHKKLEIWNLYNGTKYEITINSDLKPYQLNEFLCDTFNIKMKNKIFLYDLETTGLEFNCDIIERHIIDYDDDRVMSTGLINPHRPIGLFISELTGIRDSDFVNSDEDYSKMKSEVDHIFKTCHLPIFIAHNGNRFDHNIMMHRGFIDFDLCKFLDSREIISSCSEIKNLYNKKLGEIYKILFNREKQNIHRASSDTEMIIEILNQLNIYKKDILKFQKSIK